MSSITAKRKGRPPKNTKIIQNEHLQEETNKKEQAGKSTLNRQRRESTNSTEEVELCGSCGQVCDNGGDSFL